MSKDSDIEELDFNKIGNAIEAIENILDMLRPSTASAMVTVGCTVGLALWKFYERDDIDKILNAICMQARAEFDRISEMESGEGDEIDLGDVEPGTPH